MKSAAFCGMQRAMQMNERLVLTRVWVEPKPLGQKPSLFVVDEAVSLFRAVGAAKPGLDLIRALATLAAVMLNPGKICPHILKGYACRLFHCHREVSLVSKLKASRLLVARVASKPRKPYHHLSMLDATLSSSAKKPSKPHGWLSKLWSL